jgi:ankyrin repeat protein
MASNLMNDSVIETIAAGNVKEIKTLLSTNPDLFGARDKSGFNLLMLGAICSSKPVMAVLLGRLYAQINDADEEGYTALMHAAKYGNMDAVQSLMNYGANIMMRNKEGDTAFKIAKKAGYKEISDFLKEQEIQEHSSKKIAEELERLNKYDNIPDSFTKTKKSEASGCFKVAAFIVVMIILSAVFSEDPKTTSKSVYSTSRNNSNTYSTNYPKTSTSSQALNKLVPEYPHHNTFKALYKMKPFPIDPGVKTGTYKSGKKLIDAIVSSDTALAKKIIEEDKFRLAINSADSNRATPLMYASYLGFIDIVNLLLKNGASVNARDKNSNTAFNYAAEEGFTGIAKLLAMKNFEMNASLMFCIARGRDELAQYLIEKGADVNYVDKKFDTPLSYAAFYGKPEIAKLLLDKGAKPSHINLNGFTPLIMAVQDTDGVDIVKMLLEKGASPDIKDPSLNTPLMWAAFNGYTEAAAALIEKGADIHAQNNLGYNAITYAGYNGKIDALKLLFQKGARIEDKNIYLDNALTWASYNGHYSVVKFLVENGADINIVNSNRYTPLTLAIEKNHYSIITLLQAAKDKEKAKQ